MPLVRKSPGQNMLGLPGKAVELGHVSLGSCPEEAGHMAEAPLDSGDCQHREVAQHSWRGDLAPWAHHGPCGVH